MQKTVREGLQFRKYEENIIYTVTKVKGDYVSVKWDKGETEEHIDKVNRWLNAPDWDIIHDPTTPTERQAAEALLNEFGDWFNSDKRLLIHNDAIQDFLTSKYGKG